MANTSSLISFFFKTSFRVKKQLLSYFFLAILVVLSSTTAIGFILKQHHKDSLTEEVLTKSRQVAAESPAEPYKYPYEIKDMTMALMNKNGTRTGYAQFTLILDCPSEDAKKEMTLHRAKLLDTIFEVGGGFYIEDFTPPLTVQGFDRFKTEIRDAYAKFFNSAAPREIVLKDWFLN